jgi:DNA invertase Pin-like site-specific DNA recombinase
VSGAEFVKRDGLNRLLAATRAHRRPFDVVVTMALDRTGRESIETSYVLKQITDAGVRVLCYSDGHEIKLDRPIDKAMLGLQGFAAEDFRFQIKNKTTEALLAKFERGYATGGAPLATSSSRRATAVTTRSWRSFPRRRASSSASSR